MNGPLVRIRLDGNGRVYEPGQVLSGEYGIESVPPDEIKAVEVSVLWHTEGKGDEDMAVHAFWRVAADNGTPLDLRHPGRFSTVLPKSPLSYRGILVKIRWCVRVRVFLARGREVVGELAFRLGAVPAARAPSGAGLGRANGPRPLAPHKATLA